MDLKQIKPIIDEKMGTHAGDGLSPWEMRDHLYSTMGVLLSAAQIIIIWQSEVVNGGAI